MKNIGTKAIVIGSISTIASVAVFGCTYNLTSNKQSNNTIVDNNNNDNNNNSKGAISPHFRYVNSSEYVHVTYDGTFFGFYGSNDELFVYLRLPQITAKDFTTLLTKENNKYGKEMLNFLVDNGVLYFEENKAGSSEKISVSSSDITNVNFNYNASNRKLTYAFNLFNQNISLSLTVYGLNNTVTDDTNQSNPDNNGNNTNNSENNTTPDVSTPSVSFINTTGNPSITFSGGSKSVSGNLTSSGGNTATLDLQNKYNYNDLTAALNGSSLINTLLSNNLLKKQSISSSITGTSTFDSKSGKINLNLSGDNKNYSLTINVLNIRANPSLNYSLQSTFYNINWTIVNGSSLAVGSTVNLKVTDNDGYNTKVEIKYNGSSISVNPVNGVYSIPSTKGNWSVSLSKEGLNQTINYSIDDFGIKKGINNQEVKLGSSITGILNNDGDILSYKLTCKANSDQVLFVGSSAWQAALNPYINGSLGLKIRQLAYYPSVKQIRITYSNWKIISIGIQNLTE